MPKPRIRETYDNGLITVWRSVFVVHLLSRSFRLSATLSRFTSRSLRARFSLFLDRRRINDGAVALGHLQPLVLLFWAFTAITLKVVAHECTLSFLSCQLGISASLFCVLLLSFCWWTLGLAAQLNTTVSASLIGYLFSFSSSFWFFANISLCFRNQCFFAWNSFSLFTIFRGRFNFTCAWCSRKGVQWSRSGSITADDALLWGVWYCTLRSFWYCKKTFYAGHVSFGLCKFNRVMFLPNNQSIL